MLSIPRADSGSCVTVDPWQVLEMLREWRWEGGCSVCEAGPFGGEAAARSHYASEEHEAAVLNSLADADLSAILGANIPDPDAEAPPDQPPPPPEPLQPPLLSPAPAAAHAWPCPVCAKPFPTKKRLERHSVVHSGVKEFACPRCNKGFTQKASLQTHIKFTFSPLCEFIGRDGVGWQTGPRVVGADAALSTVREDVCAKVQLGAASAQGPPPGSRRRPSRSIPQPLNQIKYIYDLILRDL